MELERHEVGIDVPSASAVPVHVDALASGSGHALASGNGHSLHVGSAHNLLVGMASGPRSSLQLQTSLDHQ